MTAGQQGGLPRKHPDAASRVYDGKAFVVLSHYGEYKILNGVGSRVWELIDGMRTAGDIARIIQQEYEVSPESALADVHEFLSLLRVNGMLADGEAGKVA